MVFSGGGIAIAGLAGSEISTAVTVGNPIGVVIGWYSVRVDWKWGRAVGWSKAILGGSRGSSNQSK